MNLAAPEHPEQFSVVFSTYGLQTVLFSRPYERLHAERSMSTTEPGRSTNSAIAMM